MLAKQGVAAASAVFDSPWTLFASVEVLVRQQFAYVLGRNAAKPYAAPLWVNVSRRSPRNTKVARWMD